MNVINKTNGIDTMIEELKKKFIKMPTSIIFNKDIDVKRVLVMSYFLFTMGLASNYVSCSLNNIIDFFNLKKPNKKSKFRKEILDVISYLVNNEYLYIIDKDINNIDSQSDEIIKYFVNIDKLEKESFVILFSDEIYKIATYSSGNNDTQIKIYSLLLLAYMRKCISFRRHESFNFSESFSSTYTIICDELGGVTYRYISKSFDLLQELNILYHENLKRIKDKDGNWINIGLIFSNMYRRNWIYNKDGEREFKEEYGEEYYKEEINKGKIAVYSFYNKAFKKYNN